MITLTGGSFQTPAGLAVANGTLRLELSQDTKVLAQSGQVAPTLVDIPLNANGSIATSTNVWGNDELVPVGSWYRATVFDVNGSRVYGPETWQLTGGGTVDVGTVVPLVTTPTVAYINSLSLQKFDNVVFADQFSGADMSIKIAAAITTVPATGGIVDARGFQGGQAWSVDPFASCTVPVTLLLGFVTVTYSVGFTLPSECQILGQGRGKTIFQQANSTSVAITLAGANGGVDQVLQDFTIDANAANNTGAGQTNCVRLTNPTRPIVQRLEIKNYFGLVAGTGVALAASLSTHGIFRDNRIGPWLGCLVAPLSTVSRTSNVVTGTTTTPHGHRVGDAITTTQITDTSFNGSFTVVSVPTSTTVTWAQTAVDASSTGGLVELTSNLHQVDAIFTSGSQNRIVNNYIEHNTDTAIVCENSQDSVVQGNTLIYPTQGISYGCAPGQVVAGCTIIGNTIKGVCRYNGQGILVYNLGGTSTDVVTIVGNVVHDQLAGAGFRVDTSGHVSIVGNTIKGIISSNRTSYDGNAIYVKDSTFVDCTGNTIDSIGGYGILYAGVTNGEISSNLVTNCSVTTVGAYAGIRVDDGGAASSQITVLGNKCFDTAAAAGNRNQGRGLIVAGASDQIFVAGNDVRHNRSNPGYVNTASGNVRLGYNLTNDNANSPETIDYLTISGQLSPATAGGISSGTAALPWSSVYVGSAGTNNTQITGAVTGARTFTLPDANSNPVRPSTAAAHQFATAIASTGVVTWTQPAFADISGTAAASQLPVFIASGASHAIGAVPDPGVAAGSTKFLREDATWVAPTASAYASGGVTANVLPKSNGSSALTDSSITDNGSTISIPQQANANTVITSKRATDTAPTGNFLLFQNALAGTLFSVDIAGKITAPSLVGLTAALTPNAAGGTTLGAAALPFSSVFVGSAGTNNTQITGTTTGARTFTLPDANSNPVQPSTAGANQFATGISSAGAIAYGQPAFSNLSGSIALGQTPLTTLGDILYVNSTPGLARLAGNTAATAAVLTQTGNATISAAPVWSGVTGTLGSVVLSNSPSLTTPAIGSGGFTLAGATSGTQTVKTAATTSGILTLPAGTTDFSSTGGASQVVKQTSAGTAFTVAQLAASDLSNGTTGSGNVVLATSPTFLTSCNSPAYQNFGISHWFNVASNFTTAANTSLQAITGLSFTVPASQAMTIPFHAHIVYSIATAAVAVAFGVQAVSVAPTNLLVYGDMQTAATTFTSQNAIITTTTATNVVSATPSVVTTKWSCDIYGFYEAPSNVATSVFQLMVSTAASGDVVTVYRGSFLRIF